MSQPPDVEFTAAMAVADRAMLPILGDRAVWAEETARIDAAPLSWPPQIVMVDPRANNAGLLRALVLTAVEQVLLAMIEAETGEKAPIDPLWRSRLQHIAGNLDPADHDVQIVLRVVNRAMVAADRVLCDEFGGKRGAHRLSGKREFFNWAKAREVSDAVRSGMPRAEALAALGFSRSSAYRAMKRKTS